MARALDLHSRGQGFDSLILHERLNKSEDRRRKSEVKQKRPQKSGAFIVIVNKR